MKNIVILVCLVTSTLILLPQNSYAGGAADCIARATFKKDKVCSAKSVASAAGRERCRIASKAYAGIVRRCKALNR